MKSNEYLPFISNDTPYCKYVKLFEKLIKNVKSSNIQNLYVVDSIKKNTIYSKNIAFEFIFIFFNENFRLIDMILAGCDVKNFLDLKHKYHSYITNIRLITIITEYLELLYIYFHVHKKPKLKSTVKNLLIITKKIMEHHMNNKKRIVIDSGMYNVKSINKFISDIASKYNMETNPNLYKTKYTTSYDKKEIIEKVNLVRTNPNTNLFFTDFLNETNDNELDILPKNDSLLYSANDIKIYNNVSNYEKKYYHYITYNNCIYNDYKQYSRKFDLFRIKFNIEITKPIIKINNKYKEKYSVPSEFVDVSIPSYQDVNRQYFYKEVQEEGIYVLNYSHGLHNYYWNTYSIHQLFDDLLKILFGPTIVPWYDAKYDKRIVRLLLLFSFYKIEKSIGNKYIGCNWICFLTNILKLTNGLLNYSYQQNSSDSTMLYNLIKPFVLGMNYHTIYTEEQSNTILKYTLNNIFYKLDELGYNHTIKIDEYYKDFELIIRFIIFYSYSMKKSCFFDVFNNLRYISGLLPYEPNKTIVKDGIEYNIIDHNNSKFKELLKLISNTVSVILFFLNETNSKCKYDDLTKCNFDEIKKECDYVEPIHYNFNSYYYEYLNNVIDKKKLLIGGKKYTIANKNTIL